MRTGFSHIDERALYYDYVRRLDAQAVLDYYGAENQRTETNKDGTTEVIHSCLIDRVEPHHANGDQNPSAACNLEKKLYTCYVWWSGDLFHLIQKLEGKESLDGIVPIVGEFLGEAAVGSDDFVIELEHLFAATKGGAYSAELPQYSDRILAPWAWVHPYLAERGIDRDTASRLHIGWDERTNRITIPHFWQGHLVGWQLRAIPDRPGQWPGTRDGGIPKYKSNSGFPKSETLYGYDQAQRDAAGSGRVIVVESPFSVIKAAALHVAGYGVVATFGAKVSATQIDLLKDFKRVYVWMDNDSKTLAGRIAERRLVNHLYRHTRVDVVAADLDKDLGDCSSAQEVELKLASAEPAVFALARYEREQRRV
jgi:hypothetical protein